MHCRTRGNCDGVSVIFPTVAQGDWHGDSWNPYTSRMKPVLLNDCCNRTGFSQEESSDALQLRLNRSGNKAGCYQNGIV